MSSLFTFDIFACFKGFVLCMTPDALLVLKTVLSSQVQHQGKPAAGLQLHADWNIRGCQVRTERPAVRPLQTNRDAV